MSLSVKGCAPPYPTWMCSPPRTTWRACVIWSATSRGGYESDRPRPFARRSSACVYATQRVCLMKELLEILDAIDRFHAQGEPMALATIVGVRGSAYRREGARLLLTRSQQMVGNISGDVWKATSWSLLMK